MHRIDGPGATAQGEWTEGNAGAGIPATEITADWMNAVQAEIIAVIEEAGAAPSKASNTQLRDAIIALIDQRIAAAMGG